jgi:hypothetical protein
MSRGLRFSVLVVAVSFALAAAPVASAHSPVARAAGGCSYNWKAYGYSYLDKLTVIRTSCRTGRYVVHHHGHLRGWHCTRTRLASSSFQYNERVNCKSRGRWVKWTFTQNT